MLQVVDMLRVTHIYKHSTNISQHSTEVKPAITSCISLAGEAKQKAIQAEQEARLAKEADQPPPDKPTTEILSLDSPFSGPIASLQEGVISGMEVQKTNGGLLASRPDHLQFTYTVQVDGDAPVRKVRERGGAWASDTEGAGGRLKVSTRPKKKGKAETP